MRAYQIQQIIPESHTLTMHLPPEVPAGPAQVIVLYPEPTLATPSTEASSSGFATVADFAAWLQTQPASERSREDIVRQIEAERDAWEPGA
ncbi:hypothetical protein [Sphaerotilus sp.]|uniref:hypothetical protein n=1 Tax=Sphaerotilus sp. TaxID=2093942 RepID=UPI00286E76BC|nr:hypothetical protein [Sphaerotilus sp.]